MMAGEDAYVNAAPSAHIAQNDSLVIHLKLVASRRDPIWVIHLHSDACIRNFGRQAHRARYKLLRCR